MRPLPQVPVDLDDPVREYLVALRHRISQELDERISTREGVIYVSEDRPLTLISPDGTRYRLSVANDGTLETAEE